MRLEVIEVNGNLGQLCHMGQIMHEFLGIVGIRRCSYSALPFQVRIRKRKNLR